MSGSIHRRGFLSRGLLLSTGLAAGCRLGDARARAHPEPACSAPPTEADIEGPYYLAGAPRRRRLDGEGAPLLLRGRVVGPDCRPLGGATLDVWHADHGGGYDEDGYRFRAVLVADDDGRYDLRTIVPGRYLNGRTYRPAHIHVKVRAAGRRTLTTQIYFEGDPYNGVDPFLRPSNVRPATERGGVREMEFDFVLG